MGRSRSPLSGDQIGHEEWNAAMSGEVQIGH